MLAKCFFKLAENKMKTDAAVEYFGGRDNGAVKKIADLIGKSTQYVYSWKDEVPEGMAYKLEVKTKGGLKAEGDNDDQPTDATQES